MRYPLLSQATLLLIGIFVPIGVPLVMGLTFYGQFVAQTASAFMIQRLADFPAETLIFEGNRRRLLRRSAMHHAGFLVMAAACSTWTPYQIDILFLLGLQCSSLAFAMVLSCRNDKLTLAYLVSFLITYVVALSFALRLGQPLAVAISIPNFMALVWIPIALRASESIVPSSQADSSHPILDMFLRVASGSFVAFSTLGLASIVTTGSSVGTAQIRLMGTALGFSAFLLPWPIKSLVDVIQRARSNELSRMLLYLRGSRFLGALLIFVALWVHPGSNLLLCGGLSLLFLNYLVVERWNIANGYLKPMARMSILATLTAFAAFQANAAASDPVARASVAILAGTSLYALLTWSLLPAGNVGRRLAAELALLSLVIAAALLWLQR